MITIIIDSDDDSHEVPLAWDVEAGYDASTPGVYEATGVFTLPEGVEQSHPPMELKVTAWITILAEEIYYTLNPHLEGEGSLSPHIGFHLYGQGSSVTLEDIPEVGWVFVQWIGEVADSFEPKTFVTMNRDKCVTAIFQLEESMNLFGEVIDFETHLPMEDLEINYKLIILSLSIISKLC